MMKYAIQLFGRVENTEPYSLSWFSPRTDLKLRPLEVKIFEKMIERITFKKLLGATSKSERVQNLF